MSEWLAEETVTRRLALRKRLRKRPRYSVGHWPAAGLYGGARLADIGVTGDSALVIEVRCPAQPQVGTDPRWRVPGSFLVVKDHDHLLAVWEGVFFELTRR